MFTRPHNVYNNIQTKSNGNVALSFAKPLGYAQTDIIFIDSNIAH